MENKIGNCGGCHPRDLANALDDYLKRFHFTKTLTKRQRVIAWLIVASQFNQKVTRFDAEWIGDHCLNTTISEIGRLDCIDVKRKETKRPTAFGKDVDCKEYWLAGSALRAAQRHLNKLSTWEAVA